MFRLEDYQMSSSFPCHTAEKQTNLVCNKQVGAAAPPFVTVQTGLCLYYEFLVPHVHPGIPAKPWEESWDIPASHIQELLHNDSWIAHVNNEQQPDCAKVLKSQKISLVLYFIN